MPIETLVRRLYLAGAKGKLEQLLRDVKTEHDLGKKLFRVTGTQEELGESVQAAINAKVLTAARLSALIDEVEENGRQHIFLFRLTPAGLNELTEAELSSHPNPPAEPTEAFYADEPSARRTYFVRRGPRVCIKQVYLAEFWQLEGQDKVSATHRIRTWKRITVRAVNMMLVDRAARTAEIRIDRVRTDRLDNTLALKSLAEFVDSIDNPLDVQTQLQTTPIWHGFAGIVGEGTGDGETYMNHDKPSDATAEHSLSNHRARRGGPDIRTHPQHPKEAGLLRDSLSVYWRLPEGLAPEGSEAYVYTFLSRVRKSDVGELGKVYVGATLSPGQLDHVIARVRHFAG